MKPNRSEVVKAIKLAWDSLDSHLEYAVKGNDRKFHANCCREYSAIIKVLSDAL